MDFHTPPFVPSVYWGVCVHVSVFEGSGGGGWGAASSGCVNTLNGLNGTHSDRI